MNEKYFHYGIFFFLLQITFPAAQTSPQNGSISFSRNLPSPEETRIVRHSEQRSGTRTFKTKDGPVKQVKQRKGIGFRRTVKILKSNNKSVQKIKVTYNKHKYWSQKQQILPREESEKQPKKKEGLLHGNSYILTRKNSGFIVRTLSGEKPASKEQKFIKSDFMTAGHLEFESHLYSKFLDGKTVSIGQTLQVPNRIRKRLQNRMMANLSFHKLELKLLDIQKTGNIPRALFLFEASLRTNEEEGTTSTNWNGRIVISAGTRLLLRKITGSIVQTAPLASIESVDMNHRPFRIKTGRFKNVRTVQWK